MKLLTVQQVAAMLSVTDRTLQVWAGQWRDTGSGDGPRPRWLNGSLIRYYPPDVAAWLDLSVDDLQVA